MQKKDWYFILQIFAMILLGSTSEFELGGIVFSLLFSFRRGRSNQFVIEVLKNKLSIRKSANLSYLPVPDQV